MAPAFFVLKMLVGSMLPEGHSAGGAVSYGKLVIAGIASVSLAVILLIDPWLLQPAYALLSLLFDIALEVF